ncbi:hypothetical protein [Paraliomyxa miuraensis]|uniref:hypothetical protein n=1 Tax=Paraliomyxa miuraensis TaxID=376150 RepID=UPI00224E7FB6|nr:hypothetical protein [Paraliomyxa miuraensis]MCX4242698.1 hypothetical protein [Paraliomyxa miuraensis]
MVRGAGRRVVLGIACGLVAGCRQPNPDWLGPASDTDVLTTSDVTDADGTAGEASVGSSAGSDSDTGAMCQGDVDCVEPTPVCIDGTCMSSGEGTPCNNDGGCHASAPFCNPDGVCQDGGEGDPCSQNGQTDCSGDSPICGPDDRCHDGSPGDPCDGESDCISGTCTDGTCD